MIEAAEVVPGLRSRHVLLVRILAEDAIQSGRLGANLPLRVIATRARIASVSGVSTTVRELAEAGLLRVRGERFHERTSRRDVPTRGGTWNVYEPRTPEPKP